ncbi:PAS domain S-box protein [Synechococcus sp. Nb3U1]|uniref:PAS domain S-box protein n=1 Tax=Synechococcus sp. Nb3U1 TaxID=1914529 RepID=UPI001F15877A|nr:PAS domain S-box protein [Synechococcus sp. Nb3U1]MCF2969830.1 PAS domain S-box protein [Synechococcus sp. Nb3U1]
MAESPKPWPHFPIRWVLILPFVVQLTVAVGYSAWFSIRQGQRNAEELVSELAQEITNSVGEHVKAFAEKPFLMLRVNEAVFEQRLLDPEDIERLQAFFWQQVQPDPFLNTLYFGSRMGDFLLVQAPPTAILHRRDPSTDNRRQIWQVDANGIPIQLIRTDDFDPRQRPWYQAALQAETITWSPIYVYAAEPILGITAALPLRDELGDWQGVLGMDLTLVQISEFLKSLQVGSSGQSFIVERSGELVATSTKEVPFIRTPGGQERLPAASSSDPLIRASTRIINEQWNGFSEIFSPEKSLVKTDQGEHFFVQVTPLTSAQGLDWLLVVAIPKAEFTQEIQASTRPILLASLMTLGISIAVGTVIYYWISQPIQSLTERSKLLMQEQLGQHIPPSWIQELDVLSHVFNQMSLVVMGSLQELRQTNECIEKQVQERTEALRQSEEKFRNIFEHALFGLILMSPESPPQFLQANTAALDLLGITKEDLKHLRWEDYNLSEYLEMTRQNWQKLIEGSSQIVNYEKICRRRDGSLINVQIRNFALRDEQGSLILIVSFIEDISERKRIEASLQESEQRFRGIFENAPLGIVIMDFAEIPRYLFANPTICQESGYTLEEIQQLRTEDHTLEADLQRSRALWQSLIREERDTYTYERQIRRKDGSLIWVQLHVFTVRTEQGDPAFVVSFSENITEHKLAEEELAHLAAIVEFSVDAIVSTDLQGYVTSWNRGAENLYGYSAAEAIGQPIVSLVSDETFVLDPSQLEDVRETLHRNKQGELVEVFLSVSPIYNSQGDWIGLSWIARDIREKRELERMRREFVSMVSHELRTPLTAIHGSLTALNTGKLGSLSSPGERLLQIAEQSTTRLIKLINDILDLERLESGKVSLNLQICSIEVVLSRAIETVQMVAERDHIQIHSEVQPNLQAKGDPDLLIQVLTNLLSNAIKFSPSFGQIWVTAESTNQQLHICVQDQGRGIPSDKLEYIFERFQQVDASDSRQKGGSGLGLAICRLIVQQHGGRIWAESEPEKGSIFHILLPLI